MSRMAVRRKTHGYQITPRDEEILRWTARHGVVTTEHIGRRFFWRRELGTYGRWAAIHRVKALEALGLMIRDKPFAHHPDVIRVTRMGAGLAGLELRPAPLVMSELRHTLAVVTLGEYLLAEHPGAELITERELRAARYRERRESARHVGGRCPDAVLRMPVRGPGAQAVRRVAIELDRVRKDARSMEAMIHAYDEEADIDVVWWYVPRMHLARVQELVRSVRGEDRFDVREAPAWLV
jgi:hypothetical protein